MKRRKFLKMAGLGTAIISIPAIGIHSDMFLKQSLYSIVKRDLSYLKLDMNGVEKFAADFSTYVKGVSFKHAQKVRMKASSEYFLPGSLDRSELVDYVVTNYLLSTDFFINKMDESKEVKYISLFDPYKRPCSNPFSNLYYRA